MGTARKDSLQKLLVRTTGKDSTRGPLARTHRYPETKLTQAKNQKVSIRKGGAFSNTYGYVKYGEQKKIGVPPAIWDILVLKGPNLVQFFKVIL